MTDDAIDIVIPAYNARNTIGEAVNSSLGQTYQPVRVIVVDDGSTDETGARAAAAGDRVTVVSQNNSGQGSARRRGMMESTAAMLLFLDADDVLEPGAIWRLRQALVDRPDSPAAYCRARVVCEGGTLPADFPVELADHGGDTWRALVRQNVIRTPGCVLMRRAALDAVGGWDTSRSLQGNEDWELWLRLAEFGPFVRLADELLAYRVFASGFSRGRLAMRRSGLRVLSKSLSRWRNDPDRCVTIKSAWIHTRRQCSKDTWADSAEAIKAHRWREACNSAMFAIRCWPRSLCWPLRSSNVQ